MGEKIKGEDEVFACSMKKTRELGSEGLKL